MTLVHSIFWARFPSLLLQFLFFCDECDRGLKSVPIQVQYVEKMTDLVPFEGITCKTMSNCDTKNLTDTQTPSCTVTGSIKPGMVSFKALTFCINVANMALLCPMLSFFKRSQGKRSHSDFTFFLTSYNLTAVKMLKTHFCHTFLSQFSSSIAAFLANQRRNFMWWIKLSSFF